MWCCTCWVKVKSAGNDVWPHIVFPGYPNQAPYPMAQPGGSVAPYPSAPGGYGDPSQAPPPGFNMGYNQGPPPVMYQPGPMGPGPVPGPEYGGPPGGISPAPAMAPAAVAVGVPPGLEYLTQVGQRQLALCLNRPKMLTQLHLFKVLLAWSQMNDWCTTPSACWQWLWSKWLTIRNYLERLVWVWNTPLRLSNTLKSNTGHFRNWSQSQWKESGSLIFVYSNQQFESVATTI